MQNAKTLNDYLNFFTTRNGADIVPYAYLEGSHLYEDILQNCSSYYLYKDEASLIQNNINQFSKHLSKIETVIEIGPGSCNALEKKTIPILNSISTLKNYIAIDYSTEILNNISNYIKSNQKNINIKTIEIDITNSSITLKTEKNHKKAAFFFGSTLGNFNIKRQNHIIKTIYNMLEPNDFLLISFDTNNNKELLLSAYDNEYNYALLRSTLTFVCKIAPDFKKYIHELEIKCVWNPKKYFIEMYFVAKNNFSFLFPNYGEINIHKGQELKGMKSRKNTEEYYLNLLTNNRFKPLEIINNSDRMKMFIVQK